MISALCYYLSESPETDGFSDSEVQIRLSGLKKLHKKRQNILSLENSFFSHVPDWYAEEKIKENTEEKTATL